MISCVVGRMQVLAQVVATDLCSALEVPRVLEYFRLRTRTDEIKKGVTDRVTEASERHKCNNNIL